MTNQFGELTPLWRQRAMTHPRRRVMGGLAGAAAAALGYDRAAATGTDNGAFLGKESLHMAQETGSGHVEFLNPEGLIQNPAFSNVVVVSGPVRTIYVGGQDAIDAEGQIVGAGDLAAQTEKVLTNIKTALAAAGAGPEHVVKWNIFVVQGQSLEAGYAAFQKAWGQQPNPPTVTAAFVSALAHPDFLVEMDAIAVVPL